jgi:cutinase
MAGYSQGGQLVHNAAVQLPASVTAKVAAAVIFGDPGESIASLAPFSGYQAMISRHGLNRRVDNGTAVQGVPAARTKIICHAGDNICQHGALVLPPHLTYGQDAGTAADFVVSVTG